MDAEYEKAIASKSLETVETLAHAHKLSEQVSQLRKQRDDLSKRVQQTESDREDVLSSLQRELDEEKKRSEEIKKQYNALAEENKALQGERNGAAQSSEEADANVEIETTVENLKASNASLKDQIAALQGQLQGRDTLLEERDRTISAQEKELKSKSEKIDELNRRLARSSERVNVIDTEWVLHRSRHKASGNAPRNRQAAAVISMSGNILVNGGEAFHSGALTSEAHMLHINSLHWTEMDSLCDAISPRKWSAACSVSLGKRGLVFGGFDGTTALSDLFIVQPERGVVHHHESDHRGEECNAPPLAKAASVEIGDRSIIFVGGTSFASIEECPVYKLDVASGIWSEIAVKGEPPACSHNMAACSDKDGDRVVCVGGSDDKGNQSNEVTYLHLRHRKWTKPSMVLGSSPMPREEHQVSMLEERYVLVVGGWNAEVGRLYDAHLFDMTTSTWTMLFSERPGNDRLVCLNGRQIVSLESSEVSYRNANADGEATQSPVLDEAHFVDVEVPMEAGNPERGVGIDAQAFPKPDDVRGANVSWTVREAGEPANFRLFISKDSSTLVKEVFSGKSNEVTLSHFHLESTYHFRVKGEYADGTTLWSDIFSLTLARHGEHREKPSPRMEPASRDAKPHHQVIASPRNRLGTRPRLA